MLLHECCRKRGGNLRRGRQRLLQAAATRHEGAARAQILNGVVVLIKQ
jgi:hypothetical protein